MVSNNKLLIKHYQESNLEVQQNVEQLGCKNLQEFNTRNSKNPISPINDVNTMYKSRRYPLRLSWNGIILHACFMESNKARGRYTASEFT